MVRLTNNSGCYIMSRKIKEQAVIPEVESDVLEIGPLPDEDTLQQMFDASDARVFSDEFYRRILAEGTENLQTLYCLSMKRHKQVDFSRLCKRHFHEVLSSSSFLRPFLSIPGNEGFVIARIAYESDLLEKAFQSDEMSSHVKSRELFHALFDGVDRPELRDLYLSYAYDQFPEKLKDYCEDDFARVTRCKGLFSFYSGLENPRCADKTGISWQRLAISCGDNAIFDWCFGVGRFKTPSDVFQSLLSDPRFLGAYLVLGGSLNLKVADATLAEALFDNDSKACCQKLVESACFPVFITEIIESRNKELFTRITGKDSFKMPQTIVGRLISSEDPEFLQCYLHVGGDADLVFDGKCLLFHTLQSGLEDSSKLLVNHGADLKPNAEDLNSMPVWAAYRSSDKKKMLNILIDSGREYGDLKLFKRLSGGDNPLCLAVSMGKKVVEGLLNKNIKTT